MSFLNVRFPLDISYGAVGGPGFNTEVVVLGSGDEQRNQRWSAARCSWDVAKACKNDALRAKLIAFFRVAKGRTYSFLFRDFNDYTVNRSEGVLVENSTPDVWQLVKRYQNEAGTDNRDITRPTVISLYEAPNVLLVAGVDYTLDPATGLVTMLDSPSATPLYWTGEFDTPVRFDIDKLPLTIEDRDFWRSQSIQLIEVRPEEAV